MVEINDDLKSRFEKMRHLRQSKYIHIIVFILIIDIDLFNIIIYNVCMYSNIMHICFFNNNCVDNHNIL